GAPSGNGFTISSRTEYVWELGASSRVMDGKNFVGDTDLTDANTTIEADEVAAGYNSGALKVETQDSDLIFGNYRLASITGIKYEDVNFNGKYDSGTDLKLAGVTMQLSGKKSMTTKTGSDGTFTFSGLVPGNYTVAESKATDTNNDGTADIHQDMLLDTTGRGNVSVTLTSGENEDAGKWFNYVYGSIHGVKFLDFNEDGVWDKTGAVPGTPDVLPNGNYAEPALEGVTFDLYEFTGTSTTKIASGSTITNYNWRYVKSATTEKHGEFWFTQLTPGTYTVRENNDAGLYDQTTLQPEGVPDEAPGSIPTFEIQSRREYVWEDGAASRPIDGMNFVGDTDKSDADGVITPDETAAGYNSGALKTEVLRDASFQPPAGSLIWGNNYNVASIHGFKFEDIDGDGVRDAGEPGLENVYIELHDANGQAFLADGSPAFAVTDANGRFWIDNVIPGQSYTVEEDLSKTDTNFDTISDDLQGMEQSTVQVSFVPAPGTEAMFQAGEGMDARPDDVIGDALTIGNYVTGSIHGFKFLDLNANGIYEPGPMMKEVPFEGMVFEVVGSNGSVGTVATNSDGEFWFENLAPGTYTLTERLDLVDKNDNGIGDDQEGLRASTNSSIELTILSRQELVWTDGAAMLPGTASADPDAPGNVSGNILNDYEPQVTFTLAGTNIKLRTATPTEASSTGQFVYGYNDGTLQTLFSALDDTILQATFDVPVDSASIDVIIQKASDLGQFLAFNDQDEIIDSVITVGPTAKGDIITLTVNAPAGQKIAYVQAAGVGAISAVDVELDNLTYTINPLKEEVNVGDDLIFGNYYAGSIHGLKLQQGTGLPAPNLPFDLIDAWGNVVESVTTGADGKFWFLDVTPGLYTVKELATPSVIVPPGGLPSIPVQVGHAQAVFSDDIPADQQMYYEGLQTVVLNDKLSIVNNIRGSIHGTVSSQLDEPVAGIPVVMLLAPSGQSKLSTVTDGDGEFDFEDLLPGSYVLQVNGDQIVAVEVSSGEEEVGKAGQSLLDPGQYESAPNPDLNLVVFIPDITAPTIVGVKFGSTRWSQAFRDEVDVDAAGAGTGIGYEIPLGNPALAADKLGQTTPFAWGNINQIVIEFSEPVRGSGPGGALAPADFGLAGVNTAAYAIKSVNYDPATYRATLNLSNGSDGFVLSVDEMAIFANDLTISDEAGNMLDGEWVRHQLVPQSGDGVEGGLFRFDINVSPGNYNLSLSKDDNATADHGAVNIFDGSAWAGRNPSSLALGDALYSIFVDGNGDGLINIFDGSLWAGSNGNVLPIGSASFGSGFGGGGSFFSDGGSSLDKPSGTSGGLIGEGEGVDYSDLFGGDDELTAPTVDSGSDSDYAASIDFLFGDSEEEEEDSDDDSLDSNVFELL
ncbi:MAG: carboxypeptidase regulatory-like domain-containing protein, partial [bacterium]|nr:carboxypeptidase regulatory-like domain-containing protein [bacterium]